MGLFKIVQRDMYENNFLRILMRLWNDVTRGWQFANEAYRMRGADFKFFNGRKIRKEILKI